MFISKSCLAWTIKTIRKKKQKKHSKPEQATSDILKFFDFDCTRPSMPQPCSECKNVCKTTDSTLTLARHEHFRACYSGSQWKLALTATRDQRCYIIGIVTGGVRKAFTEWCPKVSLKFISGRVLACTGRLLVRTENRATDNVLSCFVGSIRHAPVGLFTFYRIQHVV